MKTKAIYAFHILLVVVAAWGLGYSQARGQESAPPAPQSPQAPTTGFTYQGSLKNSGAPVNATCQMAFRLYASSSGTDMVGTPMTTTVSVANGLFSKMLDFGNGVFDGTQRWLDVKVKCPGETGYTALDRQEIKAAPYALYSPNAGTAVNFSGELAGDVNGGQTGTTVRGLLGISIAESKPIRGQVLKFDGDQWAPGDVVNFTGGLGGDVTGTQHNTKVTSLQGIPVSSATPAPAPEQVLKINNNGQWAPGEVDYFNGSLHGDVTGGQSSTTVTKLQGTGVSSTAPTSGQVLKYNGSQWGPATLASNTPSTFYYPLLQAQSLDLAAVDSGLKGFYGGFTDGRYGYFVPFANNIGYSGKVARVDLQNFAAGGVTWLDLGALGSGLTGFMGGFSDGRYGYFVPFFNSFGSSGIVARVDLQNFTTGGVSVLNLATVDSNLMGFWGGFTDGRNGYFVPNNFGSSGTVARVDLQNFTAGGVVTLTLTTVDSSLKGFRGGFTDGRYGYFVPYSNGSYFGKVARVDLQNFTTGGVSVLDLAAVDSGLKGFAGGFSDGRYGYFVPYSNGSYSGKVARVDLQNFAAGGVTVLDLAAVDSGLKGFAGGFTDGRYGYFVPSHNDSDYSGKLARVDLLNFAAGGVTTLDLAALDSGLKGFYGGFSDGRYGYFVPNSNSSDFSGKLARIPLFFGGGAP